MMRLKVTFLTNHNVRGTNMGCGYFKGLVFKLFSTVSDPDNSEN